MAAIVQQPAYMLAGLVVEGCVAWDFDDQFGHIRLWKAQRQVAGRAALAHQQFIVGRHIGTLGRRHDALEAPRQHLRPARAALSTLTGKRDGRAIGQRGIQDRSLAVRGERAGRQGDGVGRGHGRFRVTDGRGHPDHNLSIEWLIK
ncbi:hypothetical protein G6F31_018154 [Rhizopus arrhizus]|nr:hypothetical protein G6F31_018154 [Rhizopus arrhizus]